LRSASGSADPRRESAAILARVEARRAHAARLLTRAVPFVREVVLGTLRWQLTLDHLLQRHLRQPLDALEPEVRAVLRAGLYEAQRLDTPVAVAVAEAVRVAKTLAPRAAGLVNAVLRRSAAAPWPDPDDASLPLALRFSHPEWLVRRWLGNLGEAATRAALAADQRPASLTLLGAATPLEALAADGVQVEPHAYVPGVVVVREGAGAVAEALQDRHAYAMDPTAVLAARLAPEADGVVVDLAAAPGGKSLVLSCERPGLRLLSLDRTIRRAAMLRINLALAPTPRRVAAADAAAAPLRDGSCGGVILDAPCSGTGTLRRHPEIRWRLREADLVRFAAQQRRLALAAARLVAPGGWMLYATCSLEPEENAGVLDGIDLRAEAAVSALPPGVPRLDLSGGGVVLLANEHGDGHTVHVLRRRR
jgi:16S rRNA (cytosine967-C5)-methyltransferase